MASDFSCWSSRLKLQNSFLIMEKKVVIFDFDGTLANTFPITKQIVIRMANRYGYNKPTDTQMNLYLTKQYMTIIKELHIPLFKIPFLLQAGRKEMSRLIQYADIYPGIKLLIRKLIKNNFIIGILTSNSKINVEIFIKKHHLPITIIHSELNLFGKDKALNRLIKKYNWDKNQVVYIGDEVRDIEACHKAKIDIIAVPWGFNNKELLIKFNPTLIVDRPNDIFEYLAKPPCSS